MTNTQKNLLFAIGKVVLRIARGSKEGDVATYQLENALCEAQEEPNRLPIENMRRVENKVKHIRVPKDGIKIWDAIRCELDRLGEQGWRVTQVIIVDMALAADLVMSRRAGGE